MTDLNETNWHEPDQLDAAIELVVRKIVSSRGDEFDVAAVVVSEIRTNPWLYREVGVRLADLARARKTLAAAAQEALEDFGAGKAGKRPDTGFSDVDQARQRATRIPPWLTGVAETLATRAWRDHHAETKAAVIHERWKYAEEAAAALALGQNRLVRLERLPGAWNEDGYWERCFAVTDLGPVPEGEHRPGTYRGDVDPDWVDPNEEPS
jgi:hypothetical protein